MTDQLLPKLERTWRESGSLADEVTYLRERVRTGHSIDSRVHLASYLGHRASQVLVGRIKPPRRLLHGADPYFETLTEWDEEVRDRSNCALAYGLLGLWENLYPEATWLREIVLEERRSLALGQKREAGDRAERYRRLEAHLLAFPPLTTADRAAQAPPRARLVTSAAISALRGYSVGRLAFSVASEPAIGHGRGWARRTIRKEVVPWALGFYDPLLSGAR